MASKVNLDALIPREDFEVRDEQTNSTGRNITTLSIRDLEDNSFFFSAVRKPDFQRETNEWDAQRIGDLIESFLVGDLIPAVILWRSASSYTFVIDGSHRLSALAAWINDDYGDGDISKHFYDGIIPEEQIVLSEQVRKLVNKKIGSFKDYQLAVKYPEKVKPEIVGRAKILGTLAIQVQWVEGDSSKAEASFFKINQQAAPIDKTELRLLQARKKPNGVAARAIVRKGKGHKYWSNFSSEKQNSIQELAKQINDILFNPNFKSPIKTLDLPIGGKSYSSQGLPLILDFINIVNNVKSELNDDETGDTTIKFLTNCRKVVQRINSIHSSSLGLHPIVYFYTLDGRHKIASFFAVVALVLEFQEKNLFANFIKVRADFEWLIIEYDYLVQQIVRKYRWAEKGYPYVKKYYLKIMFELLKDTEKNEVIKKILEDKEFSYLKLASTPEYEQVGKDFSREKKSAIFIKEAFSKALRCKICGGYLHINSITIDHIKRKEDGGLGEIDNGQLAHPYCNSTVKN